MPTKSCCVHPNAARLLSAVNSLNMLPNDGVMALPVVGNLTAGCTTLGNLQNKLEEVADLLANSNRFYRQGNSIVMEFGKDDEQRLVSVTIAMNAETCAQALLAQVFVLERLNENGEVVQFPPSKAIAEKVLIREATLEKLRRIRVHVLRPVFDSQFRFCRRGYHAEEGILVHGPDVPLPEIDLAEVLETSTDVLSVEQVLERLPPHLSSLLGDFCFREVADLCNAVGVLLTGVLINHFIEGGHPVVLLDGNQPGLGKTYFSRTVGIILDGKDPYLINYTSNDEELTKRILSTLRPGSQSCIIVDNAKVKTGQVVSSEVFESNSVAADISLRILGKSENYVRPNDCMWFITMNDTKVSPDIVSRGIPVRFRYEGDAARRTYRRDAIPYAKANRIEILSELYGMVLRWIDARRPEGKANSHRFPQWARIIGGILQANGLAGFLANREAAAAEFNSELDDLVSLAEIAIKDGKAGPWFRQEAGSRETRDELVKQVGQVPKEWQKHFERAGLLGSNNERTLSPHKVGNLVSRFFSSKIDREVEVLVNDQTVRVALRKAGTRSNQTAYCFEVLTAEENLVPNEPSQPPPTDPGRQSLANERRRCVNADAKPKPPHTTPAVARTPTRTTQGNDLEW